MDLSRERLTRESKSRSGVHCACCEPGVSHTLAPIVVNSNSSLSKTKSSPNVEAAKPESSGTGEVNATNGNKGAQHVGSVEISKVEKDDSTAAAAATERKNQVIVDGKQLATSKVNEAVSDSSLSSDSPSNMPRAKQVKRGESMERHLRSCECDDCQGELFVMLNVEADHRRTPVIWSDDLRTRDFQPVNLFGGEETTGQVNNQLVVNETVVTGMINNANASGAQVGEVNVSLSQAGRSKHNKTKKKIGNANAISDSNLPGPVHRPEISDSGEGTSSAILDPQPSTSQGLVRQKPTKSRVRPYVRPSIQRHLTSPEYPSRTRPNFCVPTGSLYREGRQFKSWDLKRPNNNRPMPDVYAVISGYEFWSFPSLESMTGFD